MTTLCPIVLLTDFGTKDAYVASMKGVILTLYPGAAIVDLTHQVEPQNVKQAAFLLDSAYRYFPPSSIFVSVVDPGVGSSREILAAKTSHGIFLAPDNGLLTPLLEREKKYELRRVVNKKFFLAEISSTFHGRDCFAPTSARLAKSPRLFSEVGPLIKSFTHLSLPIPKTTPGKIRGEIVFFDHFGNAFTNIPRALVKEVLRTLSSQVCVKGKTLGAVKRSYFEGKRGEPVALFSSNGLLEIAVNCGSVRDQWGLQEGDAVEIF